MPGGDFVDRGGVDAGVLADIERMQVQAKGADGEKKRIYIEFGEAMAVVFSEGLAEESEVLLKLGGVLVRR